jgi:hypothetical protein
MELEIQITVGDDLGCKPNDRSSGLQIPNNGFPMTIPSAMAGTPGTTGKTHFRIICSSSQIAFRNNPGQYSGSALSEHRMHPEPIEK